MVQYIRVSLPHAKFDPHLENGMDTQFESLLNIAVIGSFFGEFLPSNGESAYQ